MEGKTIGEMYSVLQETKLMKGDNLPNY